MSLSRKEDSKFLKRVLNAMHNSKGYYSESSKCDGFPTVRNAFKTQKEAISSQNMQPGTYKLPPKHPQSHEMKPRKLKLIESAQQIKNCKNFNSGQVEKNASIQYRLYPKINNHNAITSEINQKHNGDSNADYSYCSIRSSSSAASIRINTTSRSQYEKSLNSTNYVSALSRPMRVSPQSYTSGEYIDPYEIGNLETSPVVFEANMSFDMGSKNQLVRQAIRPSPSFVDPCTASSYLSEKIQNFLKRTDHVQDEWTAMNKRNRFSSYGESVHHIERSSSRNSFNKEFDLISLIESQRKQRSMERSLSIGRSRSVQNILTKAFQLSNKLENTSLSLSNSRETIQKTDDDPTIIEDELSEITADLTEERSAANIATERLESQTGERLKLEKDLNDQQSKVKKLQEITDKLEMDLICAKSDMNSFSEDDDPDNNDDRGVSFYKLKYDRVSRELEFTKKRLRTQHEYDLEQLIGLKKQLEKKLADAYEEVEEQRLIVGQWKRKYQKMTNELNDLRRCLEEQNARNNILEKKQRKFDTECQAFHDCARQERQSKERLLREKDLLNSEKFILEQTLADLRIDLELKDEKLASLQKELEELAFGGGSEDDFAQLRRSKNELERRLKEQEEELDEMAGQVQLLEQAKLRLEMTLETMRKEARKEAQQRDEELEEVRGNNFKKIKSLECQLETEHEERTLLLREKNELERRLSSMEDRDRIDREAEEVNNQKMKKDLRKYKALLKDAQTQLDRFKADTPGKSVIRQLRNQLDDAESMRLLSMKAKQTVESELAEVQSMLEEANRARIDAEDRANFAQRDRSELQTQIEENEEELSELMRKYSATVKQLNTEQITISEYEFKLSENESERNNLKEQIIELQHRLENVENMSDPSATLLSKRLELRLKEVESRLELEQATRSRVEIQANRHKESLEKIQTELSQSKMKEKQVQDMLKKSQKSLREMREEFNALSGREQESVTRRKDLEKKIEQLESEGSALKNDLRLALQRIADLQQAMEDEEENDLSESGDSLNSVCSISDVEERLRPTQFHRNLQYTDDTTTNSTNTLLCERDNVRPRITLTSPTSPKLIAENTETSSNVNS